MGRITQILTGSRQHVAVVMGTPDSVMQQAVSLARFFLPGVPWVQFYSRRQVDELAGAIVSGDVTGIAAARLRQRESPVGCLALEEHLREIVGRMHPDASVQIPEVYPWDPEYPFRLVRTVGQLLQPRMYDRPPLDDGEFVIDAHVLIALICEMKRLDHVVHVTVVDDHLADLVGIQAVLTAWSNIEVAIVLNDDRSIAKMLCPDSSVKRPPDVLAKADIVLLDEDMLPKAHGHDIMMRWRKKLPGVLVASTTSGNDAPWYGEGRHFNLKREMISDERRLHEFVAFMNGLLARLDGPDAGRCHSKV